MTTTADPAGVVDPAIISTDADDLSAHARDMSAAALLDERSRRTTLPHYVVRPRTTDEVAALVQWASKERVSLYPYGAASGVSGGIAPEGGVVVDMRAMNGVGEVDDRSLLVEAQAGVIGGDLAEALARDGYSLGHAPQSIDLSTVGGWVATKACGQLSSGHGGIEDLVAGLEGVVPAVGVVRSGAFPRRSIGPEPVQLLLGSEGSLGIVTAVTLRVVDLEDERADRCIRFAHMSDAVAACRVIARSRLHPLMLRLYDADDTALFFRHHPDPPDGPLLLLSFDGDLASERADRAVERAGGSAVPAEPTSYWWAHRNDAVRDYRRAMAGEGILGPHAVVDTVEVSGTWAVLRELYHSMKEALGGTAQIAACHVSHVYPDGACLYFTLASACEDEAEARRTHDTWWRTGMETCMAGGGSISHHHGVGRLKAPWAARHRAREWELVCAVKSAFDPHGIMNPGVLGL